MVTGIYLPDGWFFRSFPLLLFFLSLPFTLFTGRVLFSTQECKLTGDWLNRVPGDLLAATAPNSLVNTVRCSSARQIEMRHTAAQSHLKNTIYTHVHDSQC